MTIRSVLARAAGKDARGSTGNTLWVLLLAPAVVLLLGLSVDGGRQLTAVQRAEAAADSAARAGVNAASGGAIIGGQTTQQAALNRARAVLAQTGVQGTVTIASGGDTMTVETYATEPTQYLSVIGMTTVTGRASTSVTITDTDR